MLKWKIIGPNLQDLIIIAETFNEALTKAKRRSQGYCAGYVVD
jgi:hypothetical protein